MKKLILFFAVAATVALTTGCTVADYGCDTYFKIINHTGADIIVAVGRRDIVYKSTAIESYKEQTIYEFNTLCAKDYISVDHYSEDDEIENLFMKINDNTIPNTIWKRRYWNFASEPYKTTFTLTLTAELLEELQQQE